MRLAGEREGRLEGLDKDTPERIKDELKCCHSVVRVSGTESK